MKTNTLMLRKEDGDYGFTIEWDGDSTLDYLVEKLYEADGDINKVKEALQKDNFKFYSLKETIVKRDDK